MISACQLASPVAGFPQVVTTSARGGRTAPSRIPGLGFWRTSPSRTCLLLIRANDPYSRRRASKEKYLGEHHTIDDDGYNVGRDMIVERAAAGSRWKTMWWIADVEWEEGLLKPGSDGRSLYIRLTVRDHTQIVTLICRRQPQHHSRRSCGRPDRPSFVTSALCSGRPSSLASSLCVRLTLSGRFVCIVFVLLIPSVSSLPMLSHPGLLHPSHVPYDPLMI